MINLPFGNKIVLQYHDMQITYQQLKGYIAGFQLQLINQKAHNCILYTNDTLEFIAGLFACYYLGVKISLPPNDSQEMIDNIKADTRIGSLKNSLLLQSSKDKIITNTIDTVITIYTSGTTGVPKQIKRAFSQLLLEVNAINSMWGSSKSSSLFASTVSYQHIYGLLFAILWPLKFGHRIWNKILPFEESLQNLSDNCSSLVVISSPAFLKRLTQVDYNAKTQMSIYCSGGVLSSNQHANAETILNNPITQVYGSSETGGIASKLLHQNWKFFPSVNSQIKNDILYVRSPFCYTSDWQNTNDMVKLDKSGFELLGRVDRIVKMEEKRISLLQVEKVIARFAGVTNVHVICLNDKRQYLAAVIVKTTKINDKEFKQQLKSYLKHKIERLAIPRKIRFVEQLPTNSQGKILHTNIKALLED